MKLAFGVVHVPSSWAREKAAHAGQMGLLARLFSVQTGQQNTMSVALESSSKSNAQAEGR